MSERLRLLIVDRPATAMGIRLVLADDYEVCAHAQDAEQAIRAAKHEAPDACLIGSEVTADLPATVRGICRAAPQCAVVVLAHERNVETLLEAVRAGAVGYVPGALDAPRLQTVMAAIAARQAVVPRELVLELILELRNGGSAGDGLSSRESQVLGMLRRGHSTADIAQRLNIAPVTVRRHISELVHKLGVADRSQLIDSSTSGWGVAARLPLGVQVG